MVKKWLMELLLLVRVIYIYQFMSKVQLPGSVRFDSQIKMSTGTENKDVSLAQEFKDHIEEEHRQKMVPLIKENKIKFMDLKWTERKYHVKDNTAVELKHVRIYCNKKNSQNYPSMVHITNLVAQGG